MPEPLRPMLSAKPQAAAQIRAVYAALGSALSVRRALAAKSDALAAMVAKGQRDRWTTPAAGRSRGAAIRRCRRCWAPC